jgi:hypothetical protein
MDGTFEMRLLISMPILPSQRRALASPRFARLGRLYDYGLFQHLHCLKRARQDGFRNLADIYKERGVQAVAQQPETAALLPPPIAK